MTSLWVLTPSRALLAQWETLFQSRLTLKELHSTYGARLRNCNTWHMSCLFMFHIYANCRSVAVSKTRLFFLRFIFFLILYVTTDNKKLWTRSKQTYFASELHLVLTWEKVIKMSDELWILAFRLVSTDVWRYVVLLFFVSLYPTAVLSIFYRENESNNYYKTIIGSRDISVRISLLIVDCFLSSWLYTDEIMK